MKGISKLFTCLCATLQFNNNLYWLTNISSFILSKKQYLNSNGERVKWKR